jgi:hypothetical protein
MLMDRHGLAGDGVAPAGQGDADERRGVSLPQHQAETLTKFKVGAMKDERIVALYHEIHISVGSEDADGHSSSELSKNQQQLYTTKVPHWK